MLITLKQSSDILQQNSVFGFLKFLSLKIDSDFRLKFVLKKRPDFAESRGDDPKN